MGYVSRIINKSTVFKNNQDQFFHEFEEKESPSLLSTTTKLVGLNVNVLEFVYSFSSRIVNISTSSIRKTPPLTPIVIRRISENVANQIKTLTFSTHQIKSNDEQ